MAHSHTNKTVGSWARHNILIVSISTRSHKADGRTFCFIIWNILTGARVNFSQDSEHEVNTIRKNLSWKLTHSNCPVINTFSATQTLTWTQFVQTLTLSDVIKRLTASPLIISGLSAKLHGKPAIFVIMMFLQKISMRKWETFTLGGP